MVVFDFGVVVDRAEITLVVKTEESVGLILNMVDEKNAV